MHRGITCNLCKVGPVRGIRYKCANCIDYDVCEACEAADTHNRNHVFVKIKVPIPPLANPRATLLQPFYPGLKENTGSLSWKIIQHLQENTHCTWVAACAPEKGAEKGWGWGRTTCYGYARSPTAQRDCPVCRVPCRVA